MCKKYHLSSAKELNSDLLNSIKAANKSKPIKIEVEESNDINFEFELTDEQKAILDERCLEDESNYFTSTQLVQELKIILQ
jgi:hypothetical protein